MHKNIIINHIYHLTMFIKARYNCDQFENDRQKTKLGLNEKVQ